jgi:hypothetical protein
MSLFRQNPQNRHCRYDPQKFSKVAQGTQPINKSVAAWMGIRVFCRWMGTHCGDPHGSAPRSPRNGKAEFEIWGVFRAHPTPSPVFEFVPLR